MGLNRKILADMAVKSPEDFAKLVDSTKGIASLRSQ